jgi:thiamine biosynthesis lipoprotein
MQAEHETALDLFGARVRILVGAPLDGERRSPALAALEAEALLRRLHANLSRFEPTSALSAMNRDAAVRVEVDPAVAMLVRAAIDAADASGGLVDASIIEPLERAGYTSSRVGVRPASLTEALQWAPKRKPAQPRPDHPWDQVVLSGDRSTVVRPPGLQIDSGGLGKGLAADLVGARLSCFSSFAVDCGGDLRLGGVTGLSRRVEVNHPFDDETGLSFDLAEGGIATSGLKTRIWADGDGYSHHLINPATGRPAWTGVVQATALAPTATQAEVLAKTALLSGSESARRVLEPRGGILVLDSGEVEAVGGLASALRIGKAAA